MRLKRYVFGLGLVLLLAACGSARWKTEYTQIEASQAAELRISAVEVVVPTMLRVSEQNSLMPDADIVWRGEPAGDRRLQVAEIIKTAAQRGTSELRGRTSAKLVVQVQQFHGLTPRARALSGNVGVNSIRFTAQLFDARTGAAISPPQLIVADMPALVGAQARAADQRGYTQKVEVTEHLVKVFRNWLGGRGEDPRSNFSRSGR